MFSTGHLIWIGISVVLIAGGLLYCLRRRPPLRRILYVCFIIGIASELIKVLSAIQIVPMVDPAIVEQGGALAVEWIPTGEYTPYLAMEHLPLELCSLYLVFLLLSLVVKHERWKRGLYAVMFASGVLGGFMGIVMSSIAGDYDSTAAFFTSVRAWQFFLFHAMVVMSSLYLGFCEESGLRFADWKKAILGQLMLDIPTFYINSVFSSEVYMNDQVVGVSHRINYFSSYVNPLGLVLTEKWQWIVYLLGRDALAFSLIVLLFLLLKGKKGDRAVGGKQI
ncbi:MAG: YwaF family protein [Firmicutes bacterium]|nr:YwaF family protein [Bacillota bacterium]